MTHDTERLPSGFLSVSRYASLPAQGPQSNRVLLRMSPMRFSLSCASYSPQTHTCSRLRIESVFQPLCLLLACLQQPHRAEANEVARCLCDATGRVSAPHDTLTPETRWAGLPLRFQPKRMAMPICWTSCGETCRSKSSTCSWAQLLHNIRGSVLRWPCL